jgi:branched-subunit amino acid aminotransferase/4-amino-4-deoxychorismate lyase
MDLFLFGRRITLMILYETFRTFRGRALLLSRHQARFGAVDLRDFVPKEIPGDVDFRVKVSVDEAGQVSSELEKIPRFESVLWPEIWRVKPVLYHRPDAGRKIWREEVVEMRNVAAEEGFQELLLTNEAGDILEGSLSNAFFVKGDGLVTAEADVLPGVFRALILEKAQELGVPVEFRPIRLEEWKAQPEALFLSNSIRGIVATHSGALPAVMQRLVEALDADFQRQLQ